MHAGDAAPIVRSSTAMADVFHEMSSKRLGMTCVVDSENRLVGVFTDGDLRRLMGRSPNVLALTAGEAMTPNPQAVEVVARAIIDFNNTAADYENTDDYYNDLAQAALRAIRESGVMVDADSAAEYRKETERGRVSIACMEVRVERAEVRTARHVSAVARALEQHSRPCDIRRDTRAASIQHAEADAAVHRAAIAPLLKETERARRISLHAARAALGHDAEAGAPFADTSLARGIEQGSGTRLVAQNVLSLLELHRELVARGGVARLAGVA
jgi:CBS domain-containing protein